MDGWAIAIALAGIAVSPISLAVQAWRQSKSEEAARRHEFRLRDYDGAREMRDRRLIAYTTFLELVDEFSLRIAPARRSARQLAEQGWAHTETEKPGFDLDVSRFSAALAAVQIVGPREVAQAASDVATSVLDFDGPLQRDETHTIATVDRALERDRRVFVQIASDALS
jgi:hypothetical protein